MEMAFELVVVPVADVARAKEFYGQRLGFRFDGDFVVDEGYRVVQLTPPGSACSIILGTGVSTAPPGSLQGLHLVVTDVERARAELAARGVGVSEVFHDASGLFHRAGQAGRVPGPEPRRASYASFAEFADPDGNGWVLQEITERLPGR